MEFRNVRMRKLPRELGSVEVPNLGGRNSPAFYGWCAKYAATNVWAEFGVCSGRTAKNIMQSLAPDGEMHLFDSYYGLPEDWDLNVDGSNLCRKGTFSKNGQPPKMNDRRVRFHNGLFSETLPVEFKDQLGLVHFDCDLYSSTRDALRGIMDWIGRGTVLVFDELIAHGKTNTNWREHEYKALAETGLDVEWLASDGSFGMAGVVR